MPSEKTNTLARAVRKDRHVAVQRITDAEGAIVRNELRMLIRHHAVRKDKHEKAGPKATYQGWRTKSGHSNNVPLLFDAGFFLVSADSSKRRDVLPRKMLPRAFSTVHRHNRASDATATAK